MPDSGRDERVERVERRLEIPMVVFAALVLPALIIEQQAASETWKVIAAGLNWCIWSAFLAEAILMIAVSKRPMRWIADHPFEVIVVVLTPPFLPASLQTLRAIRLLRLLRLVLVAKRIRHLLTPGGISHAALCACVVMVGGGSALRVAEPELHLNAWDSMWWAMVTATTVGYGDISPRTHAGQAIAAVVMIVGVGFIALLTAAVAQVFIQHGASDDEDEIRAMFLEIRERLDRLEQK